jgi:hypothetical protein
LRSAAVCFPDVKNKAAWPMVFILVFALTRFLGVISSDFANFSAAYALMFCAGVYFPRRMAWWLPLGTMLVTDVGLNFVYAARGWDVWKPSTMSYQFINYLGYAAIIRLGQTFKPQSSFVGLLGGGLLGAILFYLVTNTASWLFNPFDNREYSRTFLGWLIAVVKGTGGWPDAWLFFRNTLLSGGLFTALFVAAMKLTAPAESPQEKEAGVKAEPEGEEEPEEAKA